MYSFRVRDGDIDTLLAIDDRCTECRVYAVWNLELPSYVQRPTFIAILVKIIEPFQSNLLFGCHLRHLCPVWCMCPCNTAFTCVSLDVNIFWICINIYSKYTFVYIHMYQDFYLQICFKFQNLRITQHNSPRVSLYIISASKYIFVWVYLCI